MRPDMPKKMREGSGYKSNEGTLKARRHKVRSMDLDSLAELPQKESIKAQKLLSRYSEPSLNLTPFRRFLLANKGKCWNDIYSEMREVFSAALDMGNLCKWVNSFICYEKIDKDGSRFFHSSSGYVYNSRTVAWGDFFYVDSEGILQYLPKKKQKKQDNSCKYDVSRPIRIPQDKGSYYSRCEFYRKANGSWEIAVLYDSSFEKIPSNAIQLHPRFPYPESQEKFTASFFLKKWRPMSLGEIRAIDPAGLKKQYEDAVLQYRNFYDSWVRRGKFKSLHPELFVELLRRSDAKKRSLII